MSKETVVEIDGVRLDKLDLSYACDYLTNNTAFSGSMIMRAWEAMKARAASNDALVAAITGLLGCAELNQDDLESDTRYMIENARATLTAAGAV